jgi:ATP-dependent protease ClpP protease subunit
MKNIKGFDAIPVDFKKMADLDIAQYSYYEHLQNRELILNQDIDESIMEKFTLQIIKWNREDLGKPINMRKPIKIYINSCGGTVADGMSFVDVIISSKTPVYTIVQAYAYSMGCLISIAGHRRFGYKSSTLLLFSRCSARWSGIQSARLASAIGGPATSRSSWPILIRPGVSSGGNLGLMSVLGSGALSSG